MKKAPSFILQSLLSLSFIFLIHPISRAEPFNLGLAKQMMIQYHDSGAYQQELAETIGKARQFILQQAAQHQGQQKLAIVLDIDETSLSNYQYLLQRDFSNQPKRVHQEILRADAPPILPMLELYKDALKQGIHVFFITGRNESERAATIKNLHRAGYEDWSALYLRSSEQMDIPATQFKSQTREAISKKGYVILASIGDQYSDIKGGYAQKGFKLPNPFYYLP